MSSQENDRLTAAEAAKVLGVSTPTVRRIVREERLPEIFVSSHHRRYLREDVEELLRPAMRQSV